MDRVKLWYPGRAMMEINGKWCLWRSLDLDSESLQHQFHGLVRVSVSPQQKKKKKIKILDPIKIKSAEQKASFLQPVNKVPHRHVFSNIQKIWFLLLARSTVMGMERMFVFRKWECKAKK